MPRPYVHAAQVIRDRARFVYGSLAHLARQLGISRQRLHFRITLAAESTTTHAWWEFVLLLPSGAVATGTATEVIETRPAASEVAFVLECADHMWTNRRLHPARRGSP